MARTKPLWLVALAEIKNNRRLQYGLAGIFLIALVEGGLRWRDHSDDQSAELQRLQTEISTLKRQSRDEAALRQTLADLDRIKTELENRVWTVQSEAIGQARLKDWLNDCMVRVGIPDAAIKLSNPLQVENTRKYGEKIVPIPGAKRPQEARVDAIREVRANMVFRFTPEALERLLAELEGGDILVAIDTLVVNRRDMRVEIGIRIPMRLAAAPSGNPPGSKGMQ